MRIVINCPLPVEFAKAKEAAGIESHYINSCFKNTATTINGHDVLFVNSGIGKVRANAAVIAGTHFFQPDFIIDTGSCGSLSGRPIGSIIISHTTYEYDLSGYGIPVKKSPVMKIHSGFDHGFDDVISIYNKGVLEKSNKKDFFIGIQACGEFIIKEINDKMNLRKVFDADACNWESAGVFFGALIQQIPCISIRVVSDLADEHAYIDYKKNNKKVLSLLYDTIIECINQGIIVKIKEVWRPDTIIMNI